MPDGTQTSFALILKTGEPAGDGWHVYAPYASHDAAKAAMNRAWDTESVDEVEIVELKTPADLEATCKIYEDEQAQMQAKADECE